MKHLKSIGHLVLFSFLSYFYCTFAEALRDTRNHLTLPYGLMLVIGQRCHQKTHFGHGVPMMEDADAPHAGTQRLVERRAVVGKLSSSVDEDVIGGGDDVGGVDPHHSDGDVGAFAPLLHAHGLIHGAHQATEIPKQALFGIPLSANLEGGGEQKVGEWGEKRRVAI